MSKRRESGAGVTTSEKKQRGTSQVKRSASRDSSINGVRLGGESATKAGAKDTNDMVSGNEKNAKENGGDENP